MEQLPAADIKAMMKNKRATRVITQSSRFDRWGKGTGAS
jgi:hypothetical protein